ncbi:MULTISPECIES: thiol-disulfide oxidoreductase DCC family protein [unclassified Serinicoccus]|uniref:thiol-disulfide oxidoreductase DCC family protein n=1 Tax=unclassified Serinicoccus TaxID=2643101 RepID=UPI003853120D
MTARTGPDRPLVLYDADCGFCTLSAGWIPRLGARVDVVPLQSRDLAALGVDADRALLEIPVLLPGGEVAWGHHAFAQVLRHCPVPLPLLGRVLGSRVLERPASAAYRWVAAHRHQLPGGTQACALPGPT